MDLNLIKYILKFSTSWTNILYLLYYIYTLNYRVPLYFTNFIISLVFTTFIWGTYITFVYIENIFNYGFYINYINHKKEKFNLIIYIFSIIVHFIPFIHILHNYKTYINNSICYTNIYNSIIKTFLLLIVYVIIYLFFTDMYKQYFRIPTKILIIPCAVIFSISTIFLYYIQSI